jgi:hypothetical protein
VGWKILVVESLEHKDVKAMQPLEEETKVGGREG